MTEVRELAMQLFSGLAVGCMRFFGSVICAETQAASLMLNAGCPSATFGRVHSLWQIKIFRAAPNYVGAVLSSGGFPKIIPSIVAPVSVDVVNLFYRIAFGHHFKNDSMRFPRRAIKLGLQGSVAFARGCYFTSMLRIPDIFRASIGAFMERLGAPKQNAALGIVRQALTQVRCIGQFSGSHLVLAQGSLVRNGGCLAKGAIIPLCGLLSAPLQADGAII